MMVPAELRELPAGRYVVEAVEEEAPAPLSEEEAGIEDALESYRQGRVVDAKRAREIIDAAANLDADIARCIERLADGEFEGPVSRLRSGG